MRKQAEKQAEAQKQVEVLEKVAKEYLSKEAIARYGNLKSAHPEKAIKAMTVLLQLIQQGYIKNPLTDEEFKNLLMQMDGNVKSFTIRK